MGGEERRRIKQHLAENVDTCSEEIWEERRRIKQHLAENVDTCSGEIWEERRIEEEDKTAFSRKC